jgi:hypothetical protein
MAHTFINIFIYYRSNIDTNYWYFCHFKNCLAKCNISVSKQHESNVVRHFNALHEKQFNQMEDIDTFKSRVKQRHEVDSDNLYLHLNIHLFV